MWTNAHKSYLINTIFVTMPVPSIDVHISSTSSKKRPSRKSSTVNSGSGRSLITKQTRSAPDILNTPSASSSRTLSAPQRHAFLMAKFPVAYLIGADDSDVIEIFGRLNAVSKTLNAEEKRAAQYSGEFHQFCLREAVKRLSIWRDLRLLPQPISPGWKRSSS